MKHDMTQRLAVPHLDPTLQRAELAAAVLALCRDGLAPDRAMALTLARLDQHLAWMAETNPRIAAEIAELTELVRPEAMAIAESAAG